MARPVLELADILREHGPAWREANRGHVSLEQLKVMSAIERCRTAALGGHVARCENPACGHTHVAFNSCRDRHCPKCQAAASRRWLSDREAELLPVPYFHVVYTLPGKLRDIAWQNKRLVYDLLMKAAAETTLAIAANPRRLGARIGVTAVLHTWGSTLTHHPHVHMIVPGGGLSLDGSRLVASRSYFLVHVNLLARLFSGRMLAMLADVGRLERFRLADRGGAAGGRAKERHRVLVVEFEVDEILRVGDAQSEELRGRCWRLERQDDMKLNQTVPRLLHPTVRHRAEVDARPADLQRGEIADVGEAAGVFPCQRRKLLARHEVSGLGEPLGREGRIHFVEHQVMDRSSDLAVWREGDLAFHRDPYVRMRTRRRRKSKRKQ
jgi:hypothetical protein